MRKNKIQGCIRGTVLYAEISKGDGPLYSFVLPLVGPIMRFQSACEAVEKTFPEEEEDQEDGTTEDTDEGGAVG